MEVSDGMSNRALDRMCTLIGEIQDMNGKAHQCWVHKEKIYAMVTSPCITTYGEIRNKIYAEVLFRQSLYFEFGSVMQEDKPSKCHGSIDLIEKMYTLMASKKYRIASRYSYVDDPVWKQIATHHKLRGYVVCAWSEETHDWVRDESGELLNINSRLLWDKVRQLSDPIMLVLMKSKNENTRNNFRVALPE